MLIKFRIWVIAVRFYHRCKELPLPPHAKDQLLRASSSVPQNIAEGYGRIGSREKRRFYRIALGSLRECQSVFAQERIDDEALLDMADHIGGGLFKLVR